MSILTLEAETGVWKALCEQIRIGVNAWDSANGIPADSDLELQGDDTRLAIPSRARPELPPTREMVLSRDRAAFLLKLSGITDFTRLAPALTSEGEYRIDVGGMTIDVRQAAMVILKRALF